MLLKASFENCFSFKDTQHFNLVDDDSNRIHKKNVTHINSMAVCNTATLWGKSGSGKSKLLDLLIITLRVLQAKNVQSVRNAAMELKPHVFCESADSISRIALTYTYSNTVYRIAFAFEDGRIVTENLLVVTDDGWKPLYSVDNTNADEPVIECDHELWPLAEKMHDYNPYKNASFLWFSYSSMLAEATVHKEYFEQFYFHSNLDDDNTRYRKAVEAIAQSERYLQIVSDLYAGLDFGISDVSALYQQSRFELVGNVCDGDGRLLATMNIKELGRGAQSLTRTMGLILPSLVHGGVAIVDNIDESLHPLLMRVFTLLYSRKTDDYLKPRCQLIASAQSADWMEHLNRAQIQIASMKDGVSEVQNLLQKEVCRDADFSKKYIQGELNATTP